MFASSGGFVIDHRKATKKYCLPYHILLCMDQVSVD